MLFLYRFCVCLAVPFLGLLLSARVRAGKEILSRLGERKGVASRPRPAGALVWIHAASVGEAQSALILIERLLAYNPALHILVTTGTVTSAAMMDRKLPPQAIHQFYPLDHTRWVSKFLNHWRPDFVLWMESELWPTMLQTLHRRGTPVVLVNGRMSEKSFATWQRFKHSARHMLSCFSIILVQTETDRRRYQLLGASPIIVTDNLKYSARALPVDADSLHDLQTSLRDRPVWLFASTHAGEEALAFRVHAALKIKFPTLLTILVPRHPTRGDAIMQASPFPTIRRAPDFLLPDEDTEIYIADTLGELGLFYHLSPLAVIGRSFSDDGGGGHNPIEAAQLSCAVLYGPHVQFQQQIYDEMKAAGAAIQITDESGLINHLDIFLSDRDLLQGQQRKGFVFAEDKKQVIEHVWLHLLPFLEAMR